MVMFKSYDLVLSMKLYCKSDFEIVFCVEGVTAVTIVGSRASLDELCCMAIGC